jgi:hypothetical protein
METEPTSITTELNVQDVVIIKRETLERLWAAANAQAMSHVGDAVLPDYEPDDGEDPPIPDNPDEAIAVICAYLEGTT